MTAEVDFVRYFYLGEDYAIEHGHISWQTSTATKTFKSDKDLSVNRKADF